MPDRGPDPLELALDAFKREFVRFRSDGQKLLKTADALLAARTKLITEAGLDVQIDEIEPELLALLQMRGGVPFWDREVIELGKLRAS
jgi:hypothetical protein